MMLKLRLVIIIVSFTVQVSYSQTASLFHGGAHGESLAHTTSTFQGVPALYGNIAGIAYADGFGADVSYDRRYNLNELATASISAVYGSKAGTFGLLASKYGFDSYSETKVGLAYGRKLGRGLSIGGMLDLLQYSVEGFGNTNKITFEAGLYAEITEKVHMGATFFSPGTVSLTQVQEVPSRISLGVKYFVSPKATLSGDITKIAERNVEFKMAIDYALSDVLGLRLGSNVTQASMHFGTYYNVSEKLRITIAYSYDTDLGSTPSLSLSYGGFVSQPMK